MNRLLLAMAISLAVAGAAPSEGSAQPFPFPAFGPRGLVLEPPRILSERPQADGHLSEVYVMPTRPGQNRVAYWDWDWRVYEFNTERGGGGVRLYFYDREREAASYAVASIRKQYVRLTDELHYLPRTPIPFILYASYAEFQATNVFFISEGTLGATDPRDLRMALPFFGNVHEFTRVSTHEMVHQITLQKIRDAAAAARVESPLSAFPLWFIEGIAEWGTFAGMDSECDYILRDLMANPDASQGYALPDFFNANAGGYIGVYKLGQARLTFISEVYGTPKVVELLERSALLAGPLGLLRDPGSSGTPPSGAQAEGDREKPKKAGDEEGLPPDSKVPGKDGEKKAQERTRAPRTFEEYLALVLGDTQERIRQRYQEWLKKRYYGDYMAARQTVADFVRYKPLAGELDSLSIADDGHLLVYRSIERETGQTTLYLQDVRDPASRIVVARDQRPGVESLHPVDRRVTSIRGQKLVWAARSHENDALHVERITQRERVEDGRVRVGLSLRRTEDVQLGDVLEVYDPALSPDGRQVAFAGIDPSGFRDIYVVTLEGAGRGKLRRLTEDVWSESDLYWDGGRLLFSSDQTETHEPNLFAYDFSTGEITRLTDHDVADRDPVPALGGVVFRSLKSGKPDLWLLKDGVEHRLTDTPSALLMAVPTTGNALLAIGFHSGAHRLYRIPEEAFLKESPDDASPVIRRTGMVVSESGSLTYPRVDMPGVVPFYQPGDSDNWRVEASGAALVGQVTAGAAGVAITDLMRDHAVLINLAIYGSLKLTDAAVFYLNQKRRLELGVGVFHTFEPRRDKTFPGVENFFVERQFGVGGLLRYPLNRFQRVEASLEIRGVDRTYFTDYTGDLGSEWERLNGGVEPELVASALIGYDTMRLHAFAGPVGGSALVGQVSVGNLPSRQITYARLMGDAQQRFRIIGRSNLFFRLAAGSSMGGGRFAPQFFLYSVDNLEGFRFGDNRLLGQYYGVANARLNIPIDWLVQVPIFTGLFAIGGFDFGYVVDHFSDAWDNRVLDGVLGADIALGALVVQLHWGKLIDTGGQIGKAPWVFNLNFRYLYF